MTMESREAGERMRNDEQHSGVAFVLGFTLGLAVGAGAAVLFAPQSGRRTRRAIRRTAEEMGDTATEKWREVRDEATGRLRDFREETERRARRSVESARDRLEELKDR